MKLLNKIPKTKIALHFYIMFFFLLLIIPLLMFFISTKHSASAQDQGPYTSSANPNTFTGDDSTYALLKIGNTIYMGGGFGIEALDATTGAKIDWDNQMPSPVEVYSLAYSSQTNTLYAGTDGGTILAYDIATSTGILTGWQPNFTDIYNNPGVIYALQIINNTLYAGGRFITVDSQPRVDLAEYDISTPTGVLTSWTMDANSGEEVLALDYANSKVYVGGNFTSLGGVAQQLLAAFDPISGNLDSNFTPNIDTNNYMYVRTLAYNNGKLYAGGVFQTIDGVTFNNLASFDSTGGADTSFKPDIQDEVHALAIKNNYLYIGESAQSLGGDDVIGGNAEAYNLQTGLLTDWTPNSNEAINSMIAEDNALYVGMIRNVYATKANNIELVLKNLFQVPVAYADIGGLTGTIYLAEFDTINPGPTPSDTPTPTPVPSSSGGGSSNPPGCSDQKPGLVQNLQLTAGPGVGQVTLTWEAPSGPVTDYSITYSNEVGIKLWGVVSTNDQTTYTVSNLPMNSNYYFWVNAVNGCMPGDTVEPEIHLGSTTSSSYTVSSGYSGNNVPRPSMPITGPKEMTNLGIVGVILTLVGGLLLIL